MSALKTKPAVFAVGNTYQIMVPVECETLMWVKIGDNCYFDESNGIIRSHVTLHRMTVPMHELDRHKEYTVCYRKIIERKPYFSETENEEAVTFAFSPVSGDKIRAYHISDAHNLVENPVAAAKKFEKEYGKIDFLILNGDVPDHSGEIKNFDNIYEIVSQITSGNVPAVFSRGNHDTRGIYAEHIAEYTPNQNGNSYYSFRLGNIWGLVLDCGEDKPDSHAEYGNTVCCSYFRRKETGYIENVIKNAANEYNAPNTDYKLIIAHNPFTRSYKEPFNIEEELYSYWAKLLREEIKPDIMLCGHTHELKIDMPGSENDALGQPCPIVIGSVIDHGTHYFAGAGFIFENGKITVVFNDGEGILSESTV